jgi:hypothetical protein
MSLGACVCERWKWIDELWCTQKKLFILLTDESRNKNEH